MPAMNRFLYITPPKLRLKRQMNFDSCVIKADFKGRIKNTLCFKLSVYKIIINLISYLCAKK
jgi:hypothetical protein